MNAKLTRILYVNHVAVISGAERGLLDLVHKLDRDKFEPIVVLPEPGPLAEQLAADNITVRYADIGRMTKTWNPFRLARYFAGWRRGVGQLSQLIKDQDIDVVHANSNTAQLYAGPAAAHAGVPCIWHCRDLVKLGPLLRRMGNMATRVVAISNAVEDLLVVQGVPSAKILRIHNAVDLDIFRPHGRRNEARKMLGVSPDDRLVAMVGQIVPWKNHVMFLRCAVRIMEQVPNSRFVIIGSDLFGNQTAYLKRLRQQAELKLPGRVLFAGYCNDMPLALEGIDVLLHPADREPFGRSILEAMAMSKPVVAINACGPMEIIRNGEDGILVQPGDVDVMADAAIRLLTDEAAATRIGQSARLRVERDFSLTLFIKNMQKVYMG